MDLLKSLSIHKKNFLKDQLPKLALSRSLFSILLSAWIIPCLISTVFSFNFAPFHHQISKFPLRLPMHGVAKTHMFLLCNGILVFLTKSSGLIGEGFGRQRSEGDWRLPEAKEEGVLFQNETISAEVSGEDVGADEKKDEQGEEVKEVCGCCSDKCREKEVGINLGIRVEEDNGEGELDENENCVVEVGSGHGTMTVEELNRKFDEFIQRLREEISIGSVNVQQQQRQSMMIA